MLFFHLGSRAATVPAFTGDPTPARVPALRLPNLKQIEGLSGKKLNFFQRLQMKLLLKKLNKLQVKGEPTARQKKQATWSMILGLCSILLIFFPFISVISIPMAIAAVVLGIMSLKGNSNTQGIIGLVSGSLVLLLVLLVLVIVVAFATGF